MGKKRGKYKERKLPYTKDEVEEFIEDAMGSITQAAANAGVPYSTFYSWMERYDIKAYPEKIKRRVALMALDRAKYLAFTPSKILQANGEKASVALLQDILNKWGKYIDYEEAPQQIEMSSTHFFPITRDQPPPTYTQRKNNNKKTLNEAD